MLCKQLRLVGLPSLARGFTQLLSSPEEHWSQKGPIILIWEKPVQEFELLKSSDPSCSEENSLSGCNQEFLDNVHLFIKNSNKHRLKSRFRAAKLTISS